MHIASVLVSKLRGEERNFLNVKKKLTVAVIQTFDLLISIFSFQKVFPFGLGKLKAHGPMS